MEYRIAREGRLRRALPAVAVVALLAGGGLVLLTDDAPRISATFRAPTTEVDLSPALVEVPASDPPPTTAAAATTSTSPPTTTAPTTAPPTTAPPDTLPAEPPEPIAPPADPRGPEDQIQLGSIAIPKLGVEEPLFEGIRLTTLDNGPGHWPGTAMPGDDGNVVVAAHRTSHGAPFRHIDQLVAGDTVEFTTEAGPSTYVVTGTQIVDPTAIWIVDQTDTPTATLFACHPPGSVSKRIVVNLELSS